MRSESGLSIRQFLRSKLGDHLSSKKMNASIESGLCEVNGRVERHGSSLLQEGDVLIFYHQVHPPIPPKSFESNRILYEDDQLLAYNKPAGISSDQKSGLLEMLLNQNSHLSLVHRLDKNTTGVILFSKDEKTKQILESLFRTREVKKTYLALVDGVPRHSSGMINKRIGVITQQRNKIQRWVTAQGEEALTEWVVKKKGKTASLVECFPVTGRTHQIRIHLASIGHPILGDHEYIRLSKISGVCPFRAPRYLLHAAEIRFPHPSKNESLSIQAPLPEDMEKAIRFLF